MNSCGILDSAGLATIPISIKPHTLLSKCGILDSAGLVTFPISIKPHTLLNSKIRNAVDQHIAEVMMNPKILAGFNQVVAEADAQLASIPKIEPQIFQNRRDQLTANDSAKAANEQIANWWQGLPEENQRQLFQLRLFCDKSGNLHVPRDKSGNYSPSPDYPNSCNLSILRQTRIWSICQLKKL